MLVSECTVYVLRSSTYVVKNKKIVVSTYKSYTTKINIMKKSCKSLKTVPIFFYLSYYFLLAQKNYIHSEHYKKLAYIDWSFLPF